MPNDDMAEMPVQLPKAPRSPAEARGRYFNSGNAFNIKLPKVPAQVFTEQPRKAIAKTETAIYPCDISDVLECPFPATTPLLLARYATVLAGDSLEVAFPATASIWYVIEGEAELSFNGEAIKLGAGDIFLLPGGAPAEIRGHRDAVFWAVGNEPQLAFEKTRPPAPGEALVSFVHYPAGEIKDQLDLVYSRDANETTSGHALIFSSETTEEIRNITPTMTLSLNTLKPRSFQPPHKHNSVAVTLVVAGDPACTKIDDQPVAWKPWATMLTPPASKHSHHNDSDERAEFLIVQDGGLHYHARTMGFEFF